MKLVELLTDRQPVEWQVQWSETTCCGCDDDNGDDDVNLQH